MKKYHREDAERGLPPTRGEGNYREHMSLIIQKFGGTSVGSISRIQQVADKIIQLKNQGHQIVVVSSAMNGETDRLIQMSLSICDSPDIREHDMLLNTGEQATVSLIAMALIAKGCPACSYTGQQTGIKTDSIHKKARILEISTDLLRSALAANIVPVIAGFQGVDTHGNLTTLGRGGSDTTAVALAAVLRADECQIYTDVDGIYTADPRIVPLARRLSRITFEEMLEMASLGAKVLQTRSVEFAGRYHVPVRVLSTFTEGPGTLITFEDKNMEQPLLSGIALDRNQAKLTLLGIPESPKVASYIMSAISRHHIDVDMIVQNVPTADKTVDFSFTVQRDDYKNASLIMTQVMQELGARDLIGDTKVAKISLVGVGMRSYAGVATTMFETLGNEGIRIQLISTSEIKISVLVDEKYLELGIRSLHTAFGLDADPRSE